MAQWNTPADCKYAKTDEYIRIEGETGTVGVSDYAQDQLDGIVFVELPEVGKVVAKGEAIGVVESVKAASDLLAPMAGTVTEVNTALEDSPELINSDPFGKGWIVKLKLDNPSEASVLMDADAYLAYCESR